MRKRFITLIICILIVLAIFYIAHKSTLGEDGILTKASNVEIEYYKKEIINIFKSTITEKYLDCYDETKVDTSKKLVDLYNEDVAINYLKEKGYLEYYFFLEYNEQTGKYKYDKEKQDAKDINDLKRNDIYYIKLNSDNSDIILYGKGEKYINNDINKNDVFLLEKKQNEEGKYILTYYNSNGEAEEIGEINFKEPI